MNRGKNRNKIKERVISTIGDQKRKELQEKFALVKYPKTKKNGLMQKLGLMFCAEKGPTMGGNDFARENSLSFSKIFMKRHLALKNIII